MEGTLSFLPEEELAFAEPEEATELSETALQQDGWNELLAWLPSELDALARDSGAMRRRREIRSGEVLLRMVLAYAVLDLSMRSVSAWMAQQQLANVSDVAVLKRLRRASPFLQQVLVRLLQRSLTEPVETALPYRVLLGDATALSEVGSTGTDWRMHLYYDPARASIAAVELTDVHGGEYLGRLSVRPGELLVCDGAYAQAARIVAVCQQGAHVLLRTAHRGLPLFDPEGLPLDPLEVARTLHRDPHAPRVAEQPVQLRTAGGTLQARLIVIRRTAEETEREQQRLRKQAKRKNKTLSERSLQAAAYVWLLSSVPQEQARAEVLAELYRVRWQVELLFKRLKSLLGLDELRAHEPEVVQSYLYGKLIAAVLVEQIARQARAFSPWGQPLLPRSQPLALVSARAACH